MSVLIVNLTGNRVGFEDRFCTDVQRMIGAQADLMEARSESISGLAGKTHSHGVIVLVAHGGNNAMQSTRVDTGLAPRGAPPQVAEILCSPTLLTQMLGRGSQPFILFWCSCSALSAELIVSTPEDPNCLGTVASSEPIYDHHRQLVACVAKELDSLVEQMGFGAAGAIGASILIFRSP